MTALSYEQSGVSLEAGYESVRRIKRHIAKTERLGMMGNIGSFGGMFDLSALNMKEPVLVSGTDGVGTKLKIAFLLDKHDTVGIDCVAMCANDVVCCGAKPLYFLDYLAVGKNVPARVEQIVAGVAEGCVQAGCALIGGETAEMPGFYPDDEYDLAGYCTGVVDRARIIDRERARPGDALIALPSAGLHSNGFSLVRRIFRATPKKLALYVEDLGETLGETLLTPTKIYVKPVLALLEQVAVKGIAHITGGGFYENIPRSLPQGLTAQIEEKALQAPPIFTVLKDIGGIEKRDMYNTFNMGVGMSLVVAPEDADRAVGILRANGEEAYVMGEVVEGDEGVILA